MPPEGASSQPLKPGSVLHSRNVTVEVNTVFQNLQSVVQSIDPAKLNSVLSAVAESLRGKGDVIGQAITGGNNVLLAVNPRMETVRQDWQLFGKTAAGVFGCGAGHPVDPGFVLDDQHDDHPHTRRRWTSCCSPRSGSPSRASTRSAETSPTWCAR